MGNTAQGGGGRVSSQIPERLITVSDTPPATSQVTITENSRMPLKAVVWLLGGVGAALFWFNSIISGLRADIVALQVGVTSLSSKLDSVESKMGADISHGWQMMDMVVWVEQFKARNPNLQIPDPIQRR